MVKWILLPVEFKGIWFSPRHGGFRVYLRDRFNPAYPPDRLRADMMKDYPDLAPKKDHDAANPLWMSREVFEKLFGKVEAVIVDEEAWNSDEYDIPTRSLIFYTEHYVVVLREYDGYEYFLGVPRDWRKMLEIKESE
jgi:hypothetical protein